MIDPSLEPHQCLFASLWMRMAWLPCWLLHAGDEAFKQGGSILALKPRADVTRSPKQGLSVALQNGLMSSKIFYKWMKIGNVVRTLI